jgi:hypothetical protein
MRVRNDHSSSSRVAVPVRELLGVVLEEGDAGELGIVFLVSSEDPEFDRLDVSGEFVISLQDVVNKIRTGRIQKNDCRIKNKLLLVQSNNL